MPSSVNLGKHLEKVVSDLVTKGRYGSRSEVLRAGVRLLDEHEKRLAELDARLAEGQADIDAGRVVDADDVFDRLLAKYEAMAK
ncbi:MAG: type II toxin-antitoxin system ParD family antitoxin [Alphaproteobacteria bacterium]|nr:type II toxin-antitoxin system ParD family antitoxin [Alphaproteobacteria bacterium]